MAAPAEPMYMTMPAEMGTGAPMYTTDPMQGYTIQQDPGMPVTTYTTAAPYTMPGGYTVQSMPAAQVYTGEPQYTYMPAGDMMSAYSQYMPPANLDHAQGKWFAPGEALPPGYVITAHPEGHSAPQQGHAMTDKARESFVVTGSGLGSALPKASAPEKKSKKSKKKKSSGCC